MKILVARTDRLGDVLLSLPALTHLRASLPSAQICFTAKPEVLEAILPFLESIRVAPLPFDGVDSIAKQGWDAALLLFDHPGLAFSLWRRRVKVRVGNRSKPGSFFLLNHGLKQRRSQGDRSEAVYNLDLARHLVGLLDGNEWSGRLPPVSIPRESAAETEAMHGLLKAGVTGRFVVLHPGMGGSALNLSVEGYVGVAETLLRRNQGDVVLTCGPSLEDRHLVQGLMRRVANLKSVEGLSLSGFRELLRRADLVVAPSTGPIHLAHCVGTPTFGIYPPVRSQNPMRWAPFGGVGRSRVEAPKVDCPGLKRCVGSRCSHFPCMEGVKWGSLILEWGNDLNGH